MLPGLAEVIGVVFEDDVGHGLLALLEDGGVLTGDFPFWEGFAVDVSGHHPSAVVVAEVDVLESAAVVEGCLSHNSKVRVSKPS